MVDGGQAQQVQQARDSSGASSATASDSRDSDLDSLAGQLAGVKLSAYVGAIAAEGYEEVQFLIDAEPEEVDELLVAVNMKKPHQRTFRKWLLAQQ